MPPKTSDLAHKTLTPQIVALDGYQHQSLHTRGIRLHAVTAGETHNPLIVLLHDSYSGWIDFHRSLQPLADCGFHVAALDLRGYGLSDKPPVTYGIHDILGDISGAIRTLGHDDAHIIAVGASAAIAWILSGTNPSLVRSMISVDGLHPCDLRLALSRAPWSCSEFIRESLLAWLPFPVSNKLWRYKKHILTKNLRALTSAQYQLSPYFKQDLELRCNAMSIDSTFPAVMQLLRLQIAPVPLKWRNIDVAVPVLAINDGSRRSMHLLRQAQKRATGVFIQRNVPGANLRPHLEAPHAFAAVVSGFINRVDR
ncbi:alpha/beta hydrolase [Corynebacterium sp. sy017]|uniref:alpha/beta fold hydrolase n=1 Tax=unclassified Corynebacterium TaxID=2624378 RepID=UPI0011863033|nr:MULTISPECIES: alpha/beta hydrolase [unclassified Corynebacterium]MBP3089394.1 alpha/beta hydrolase [Corynebacterium sp. sy017]QDZ43322.1 alpha/beta hydrolase [Corynebacterium sp. sy039]TSD90916.1 alpha/beta hydrolase [Corynebacterium sp. SY003]